LVLNAEQVAAAVASGCVFEPASPAAVQRLAMQRKVFYIDGQAMLAGRGDGLFETVGTLMQLIEQGRQVLAYQEVPVAAAQQPEAVEALAEAPAAVEPAEPEPIAVEAAEATAPSLAEVDATPQDVPTTIADAAPAEVPAVKRRRAAPRRPLPAPALVSTTVEDEAPAEALPPLDAVTPDLAAADQAHLPARRPGRTKPRWVTAGAERRGRRDNHWSSRQK
jgi:hypothetical protein